MWKFPSVSKQWEWGQQTPAKSLEGHRNDGEYPSSVMPASKYIIKHTTYSFQPSSFVAKSDIFIAEKG